MLDVYTVLDVALRSGYLTTPDLPAVALWGRLPGELRSAVVVALASGGGLETVLPAIWEVRASRHGKPPVWDDEAMTGLVRLKLGMAYLAYRKGSFGADELLKRAFHAADSYDWDPPQQRDFLDRRREVKDDGPDDITLAILFEPYLDAATRYVEEWGLA